MPALPASHRLLYVSGLPRAGSTLLCQLLGLHPHIDSPGHSSPLWNALHQLRETLSDDPFWLSQLDVDFERNYARLLHACRGFMAGWFHGADKPWVVDKNRGWLMAIETLRLLDPDFRMVVCLRDPVQVFGSIEAQHQKTLLLSFPDHIAPHSAFARADKLFGPDNVISGPLKALENLPDYDPALQNHLAFVTFEALLENPVGTLNTLWAWLGLPRHAFDPQALPVRPHESDSYYRFKYPHTTHRTIRPPTPHQVAPRIVAEIHKNCRGFYAQFYPEQPWLQESAS
jgi:sulfotransferase